MFEFMTLNEIIWYLRLASKDSSIVKSILGSHRRLGLVLSPHVAAYSHLYLVSGEPVLHAGLCGYQGKYTVYIHTPLFTKQVNTYIQRRNLF